ncbi:MAG: alpha/beta hydrolase [Patescibacteria group bacterium]|nr:alpha/beta hydrolase [Patescibacteria group bacterium]
MKTPIVILHGWRKTGSDYTEIRKIFEKKGYSVFAPDLPGFGTEPLGKAVMHIDDYVAFVKTFFEKRHITKAVLIGHSFGGRVAAKFSSENSKLVKALILTGAPLIKQPLSVKKKIITFPVRAGKKIVAGVPFLEDRARKMLYYLLGEWDYYKATPEIRETFKSVIAEDVAPVLPNISVPTLVLWGENDTFVPKMVGKYIAERVKNGIYKVIPGTTHKLPYESPSLFAEAVLQFISQ